MRAKDATRNFVEARGSRFGHPASAAPITQTEPLDVQSGKVAVGGA
jgi:hypothetical protein